MFVTIDEAKKVAKRLTLQGEVQVIVQYPTGYDLFTFHGFGAFTDNNGNPVVARRSFQPTDYEHDQQGAWVDV